jgi:hypothetical protein
MQHDLSFVRRPRSVSSPTEPSLNPSLRERFAEALGRLAGDEEMLVTLAEIASEDGPLLLDKLKIDVQKQATAETAKTAHALKGLLSSFETGEPTLRLQPLIESARHDEASDVQAIFNSLEPDLRSLMSEIQSLSHGSVG